MSRSPHSLRERHRQVLESDPLTGLGNHRAFVERLASEIRRSERFDLPLSAFLLDLDGFGAYNEAHGYGLGDEALVQVAELVRTCARPADMLARFDADGIAVLLPECGPADAMGIAEELRTAIATIDPLDLTGWQGGGRTKKGRPNFMTVQRDGKLIRSCYRGLDGGQGQQRAEASIKKLMGEAHDDSVNERDAKAP